jgi:uncharacterized protein YbjT (DUF2867 family)/predicted MFS family arabinose efflux permease
MATRSRNAPAGDTRWSAGLWGLVFVLSGNMLLDALEVSVVIVALPSIGRDLLPSVSSAQWVMSGFAIGFGGLMLFGGRVVALLGSRRVYLVALLGYAAMSLVGGLADSALLLIASRVAKGFCVALTAPTGLSIISTRFPDGPARRRAMSIYTLFGASGFAVGLVLSGALTQFAEWRWTFLFPAPVALVLFGFAVFLIPRGANKTTANRRYDVAGAATFVVGLCALVYAIVTGPGHGWTDPRTLAAFALATGSLAVFVGVERTAKQPLIRLKLLRNRALVGSSLGAAALNGSYWGFLFVSTFRLQQGLHWPPLQTGLALLPASVLPAVAAPFSGALVARFGASRLIAAGAVPPAAGFVISLIAGGSSNYLLDTLPTLLLVGLGYVIAFSALHMQAISDVPAEDRQMTTGSYQTSVQIGGALVLALVAALLTADRSAGVTSAAPALSGYRPAMAVITAISLLGLVPALAKHRDTTRRTMKILVTGATGNVGPHAIAELIEQGAEVRALVLPDDPGAAELPACVDVHRGDLGDPDSLDRCLDGVDGVLLMWPFFTLNVDTAPKIVRKIADSARRVVFISSIGVHIGREWPDDNCHAFVETLIEPTDLEWTFLRVTGFDCNARSSWESQIRAGDVVRFPHGAAARSSVHEADVAAVAVRALLSGEHAGKKYAVTGPEALTLAEHVHTIGDAIGRPLHWQDVPHDAALERLHEANWPPGYAEGALDYFASLEREPELVSTAVRDVTGKQARTFQDWAAEHTDDFR